MYIILVFLFIAIAVVLCKAIYNTCSASSEPARTPAVAASSTTTTTGSGTKSYDMESLMRYRTSMGNILVDDTNRDEDDDEEEIHVNASSSSINSLPVGNKSKVLSADFGDNNVHAIEETCCSICLVNYQHGDRIQRNACESCGGSNSEDLICDHIFHPECITNWIKTVSTSDRECPICRRPFILLPPV